ncbi:PilZ domain-containing protein [Sphingobium bisphenolivorans]|uniref:PilZ domain-containing protein n=1 Tax=Sphingobium bisphenolivorans TaxID=1335760 RepID=UPI000399B6C4|nr:PilZ domain-containing protein [Sphingobium bisphenolivorans]
MIPRSRQRTAVDIPVVVTSVLDSLEGIIVDLSEGGAQITGCSLPVRSQCQLDYDGHIVFGIVQWSEQDRMGLRFPYELSDGPLFDRLEIARATGTTPNAFMPRPIGAGGFGRRVA